MADIKKRFYKKDLTICTEIDIDTRKVTSCQVFWNGTVLKYKTKKQAKITEQVLEICEALAHIQNLIKDYNKVIVGLRKEIKMEEK